MKLEENMYVRTKNGEIHKIKSIDDNFLKYENGFGVPLVLGGHITKASHSIIDLIQVGDYVNGLKVYEVRNDIKGFGVVVFSDCSIHEWQISSIVTKEQFEQMQYKVDE